jgi:hypothetical protein
MGIRNTLAACFTFHQLKHSDSAEVHENKMPARLPWDGITTWREAPPIVPTEKDSVRAEA